MNELVYTVFVSHIGCEITRRLRRGHTLIFLTVVESLAVVSEDVHRNPDENSPIEVPKYVTSAQNGP